MADQKVPNFTSAPIVVCLAAGNSQKPVIEKARSLGFQVVGVDQNPQADAAHLCELLIPLSTHHGEPIVEALKANNLEGRISAVLNRSSGPPVKSTAIINEALGLPGVPPIRAHQCLNKDLLRQECQRQGVCVVQHQVATKFSELNGNRISFPCVVKPTLSLVGKHGVVVVHNPDHLEAAFEAAKGAAHSGQVLVEDYIPGHDVSVIAFVNQGSVEILALLDEINQLHPDGTVSGRAMAVPSIMVDPSDAQNLTAMTQKIACIFEIHHSPLLLSFRISPDSTPLLVEIHLDMGGDLILDILLPAAGNFDPLGYMIQALSTQTKLGNIPAWQPTAVLFSSEPGLNSRNPHRLVQASSAAQLRGLIEESLGEVLRP